MAVQVSVLESSLTAFAVLERAIWFGPVHSAVTVTGVSIYGFTFTVQMRLQSIPRACWMGSLETVTQVGAGTIYRQYVRRERHSRLKS